MEITKKVYSAPEAKELLLQAVDEIVSLLGEDSYNNPELITERLTGWASALSGPLYDAIGYEIAHRHVQGIMIDVWVGPPGSGKGTNIDTLELLGKAYAEVVSQGGARQLQEPMHTNLLNRSLDRTVIVTGTGGMFNKPTGEYVELFGKLVAVIGPYVASGGFVPDAMVSVLTYLLLLYRLTQNYQAIQIDLVPRTRQQFVEYQRLLAAVTKQGGKITSSIVILAALPDHILEKVTRSVSQYNSDAIEIGKLFAKQMNAEWYLALLDGLKNGPERSSLQRFEAENVLLRQLFEKVTDEAKTLQFGAEIIQELETVVSRMEYRFHQELEEGKDLRPDAFPTSIVKRLLVYVTVTAPTFYQESMNNNREITFYVVSTAGTPEEVAQGLFEKVLGNSDTDEVWKQVKVYAGKVASALVYGKRPLVDDCVRAVGGILLP